MADKTTKADTTSNEAAPLNTDQLTAILAKLTALAETNANPQGGLSVELIKEAFKASAQEVRDLIRENKELVDYPAISYLNPEGDLARRRGTGDLKFRDAEGKPREVWFSNRSEQEAQLSPLEIELYNAIQHDCQTKDGKWVATITKGGNTPTRLTIKVNDSDSDARLSLPSLPLILNSLVTGEKTTDVNALITQIKQMQEQIDKVQSGEVVAKQKVATR